jgi:hypothetical protein
MGKENINTPNCKIKFSSILPYLKIIANTNGFKLNRLSEFKQVVFLYKAQQN